MACGGGQAAGVEQFEAFAFEDAFGGDVAGAAVGDGGPEELGAFAAAAAPAHGVVGEVFGAELVVGEDALVVELAEAYRP